MVIPFAMYHDVVYVNWTMLYAHPYLFILYFPCFLLLFGIRITAETFFFIDVPFY